MQHTKKHSYQVALWAFTLILSTLGFGESLHASSKSKPIEILSDPFGYGVPTHYTILRGHTKATFSHPMFGQFTRAEIVQREKDGYRTTRFALSIDGKAYQPVMIQFRNFETYGYPKEDEHCVDPSLAISPLSTVKALGSALKDGELIAKRRDELAKARFFDASCFDPSITEEHRNAIFNAAADVLTPELQDKDNFPKYLRCLETYGLAHESGIQQGLVKQVVSGEPIKPKLKLSCTKDAKAKTAEFREKQNEIVFRITPKPDRETYAQKAFHELQHTVPIKDGLPLDLVEECCTMGEQCAELQVAAEKRKLDERQQALLNRFNPDAQIADAARSISVGSELTRSFDHREPTSSCTAIGEAQCRQIAVQSSIALANQTQCPVPTNKRMNGNIFNLLNYAIAATENCLYSRSDTGVGPELQEALRRLGAQDGQATFAEVAKQTPVTSPISWDAPVETQLPVVPLGGLASNGGAHTGGSRETTASRARSSGGRTIASIAPLPEPTASKSLGSARGRRDVTQTNRATVLVDTLERAASSVTKQLTFEKLDARKVEPGEVFRSASTDKEKPIFVVASLAERPFQIANVADVKGLTFPNPFAKAEAMALAKATDSKSTISPGAGSGSETRAATDSEDTGVALATGPSAGGLATGRAMQTASAQPVGFKASDRSPSKTNAPDFENMSHSDLRKFLVGSYRQVAEFLEDQKFARALLKNGIQIYDHENRQIGATKPAMVEGQMRHTVFIYSAEKSRLIQSRATTRDQVR